MSDHDGSVEGEAEDDPVPDCLEGAVVEEDVRGGGRRLLKQDTGGEGTWLAQHTDFKLNTLTQKLQV